MPALLSAWSTRLLTVAVLLCVLVPAGAYWLLLGREHGVPPEAVAGLLADGAVLVDLRADGEPLPHAERNTATTLLAASDATALPPAWLGRQLILACDSGLRAAQVAAHLRQLGVPARRLEGGVDAWRCAAALLPAGATPFPRAARAEPPWKQGLVVVAGLVVKPLYMLLTLVLALRLRTATHRVLVNLRWALWLFLLGEVACAINLAFYHEASVLFDYLHGWGMALAVSAAAWAGLGEAIGPRPGCALEPVCRPCSPNHCRAERLLPLLPLVLLFTALIPLTASPLTISTTTALAGQPYAYRHELSQVLFELRVLPLGAVLFAGLGLVLALLRRSAPALACTALAAGPLSFALLRLVLGAVWRDDPAWFLAWEELAELASLLALWWVLAVFTPRARDPGRAGENKQGQGQPLVP